MNRRRMNGPTVSRSTISADGAGTSGAETETDDAVELEPPTTTPTVFDGRTGDEP